MNAAGQIADANQKSSSPGDGLNPTGIKVSGIRMVPVCNGKYKVWTKRLGSGSVKVLLLHGGPGIPHDYLEAMESFLPQAGIEIFYYDQLGCGNSDIPEDKSLWSLPRYVTEVEEVRKGLGLDEFVLFGHSWGGALALEYALDYQRHLRGLVISSADAGVAAVRARSAALQDQIVPELIKQQLEGLEIGCPAYRNAVRQALHSLICRIQPWPEPLTRSVRLSNPKIRHEIIGDGEFAVHGNLNGWERWDRLHEIKTKTLILSAVYDLDDPEAARKMAAMMPDAQVVISPRGGHMPFWDDQEFYFDRLISWLRTI